MEVNGTERRKFLRRFSFVKFQNFPRPIAPQYQSEAQYGAGIPLKKVQPAGIRSVPMCGARGENRTHTTLRSLDFKSRLSTSFSTRAKLTWLRQF